MIEDSKIEGNSIGCTGYATEAKKVLDTNVEDFAEATELYLSDRETFKVRFPNRYRILEEIYTD